MMDRARACEAAGSRSGEAPLVYQRAHMELSVRNLDAADGRGLRNNEGGTP